MNNATIFNIQRYSIQDGPGIRTTVFFKGCPLKCLWCDNPESQSMTPELAHNSALCNCCGECEKVCPSEAIKVSNHVISVNRDACDSCGKCIDVCSMGALKLLGNKLSILDVMDEVYRDVLFYKKSDGGVTCSGGEPLFQADFVRELFRQCKLVGLHTCLDTSGYAPTTDLEKVLEFTDLVYYDLKHMNSFVHNKLTGVGNEVILYNLKTVAKSSAMFTIRIPLKWSLSLTVLTLNRKTAMPASSKKCS